MHVFSNLVTNCFFVDICMCVCVCVFVCVPTLKAINNWWHDMDPIQLVKQVVQLLYVTGFEKRRLPRIH